jgi:glucosamine kinase
MSVARKMVEFEIGVDGGGTSTVAVVAPAGGAVIGRGSAGPSALGQGIEAAWAQIESAVHSAFVAAGLVQPNLARCALAAGLSGVNHRPWRDLFIKQNIGLGRLKVETDGFIALLGAHDGKPGVMVAAGTGSVGESWSVTGAREEASGWGFPTGDEGSGAWLGFYAARHTQCVMDGRAPSSALAKSVMQRCGNTRAQFQQWCIESKQFAFAQLAPLVFAAAADDADPVAIALLKRGAAELQQLGDALDTTATLPIAICGSVAERLQAYFDVPFRARCVAPATDAATGALHLLRLPQFMEDK